MLVGDEIAKGKKDEPKPAHMDLVEDATRAASCAGKGS